MFTVSLTTPVRAVVALLRRRTAYPPPWPPATRARANEDDANHPDVLRSIVGS